MDPNVFKLYQNGQSAQDQAKTFSQMLQDRSNFVQQTQGANGQSAQNLIQNGGDGGVRVNPAEALAPSIGYAQANQGKSEQLYQLLAALNGNATNAYKASGDLSTQQQQNSISAQASGLTDPTGLSGGSGTTGGGINGKDAISQVAQQNGDYLLSGLDSVAKMKVAKDILSAGGVSKYLKTHGGMGLSGDESNQITNTNDVLAKIARIKDRIENSKALSSYLGNRVAQTGTGWFDALGGDMGKKNYGLSDQDIAALNDLNGLNASGDKAVVGGKLDNYLAAKFGSTGVGKDHDANTNKAILKDIEDSMTNKLNQFAKEKGYESVKDIPGINYHTYDSSSGGVKPKVGNYVIKAVN